MKYLIPLTNNEGNSSLISFHFGRGKYIAIYDDINNKLEITHFVFDHSSSVSPVDQAIQNFDFDAVIVIDLGRRAKNLLEQNNKLIKKTNKTKLIEVIKNIKELKDLKEPCKH
jgi:predicted Fe-Mo cluster-binding NifX family protein